MRPCRWALRGRVQLGVRVRNTKCRFWRSIDFDGIILYYVCREVCGKKVQSVVPSRILYGGGSDANISVQRQYKTELQVERCCLPLHLSCSVCLSTSLALARALSLPLIL